jgi:hypothetical protein
MGLSRQSLAVGTIGPVKPEPKKQQATARRWPRWSPSRGTTSAPRTIDYVRNSVVELAVRSKQAERSR